SGMTGRTGEPDTGHRSAGLRIFPGRTAGQKSRTAMGEADRQRIGFFVGNESVAVEIVGTGQQPERRRRNAWLLKGGEPLIGDQEGLCALVGMMKPVGVGGIPALVEPNNFLRRRKAGQIGAHGIGCASKKQSRDSPTGARPEPSAEYTSHPVPPRM